MLTVAVNVDGFRSDLELVFGQRSSQGTAAAFSLCKAASADCLALIPHAGHYAEVIEQASAFAAGPHAPNHIRSIQPPRFRNALWNLLPNPAEATKCSAAESHREGVDFKRLVIGAGFFMVAQLCAELGPVANLGDLFAATHSWIEREAKATEGARDSFITRQCKVGCHAA